MAQILSFGTFPGGEEWIIRLISAEAEALLCLAELGNIQEISTNIQQNCKKNNNSKLF